MAWQTIESAPRDGTWVRLKGGTSDDPEDRDPEDMDPVPPVVVARWEPKWGGAWVYAYWDGAWRSQYFNPTHWAPAE